MNENLPKVLVISHTPFAASDSMGSTLASYFGEYAPDRLAQFYIKNITPDLPVCNNFYKVTDNEILRKILHSFSQKVGTRMESGIKPSESSGSAVKDKHVNKENRALGLLIRNLVWSTNIWNNKRFKAWVKEFSPDLIMLQPGDFSYIFKIALKLSKKLDIPLVIHQSESYYLKPYISKSLIYKLYRYDYKKVYEKAMKRASLCIYLCEALERDYKKYFTTPSVTVYKSTSIVPEKNNKVFDKNNVKFIYGGNLGETVGRCAPLAELGRAVKENGFYIDVYTASKGEYMRELTEDNGIRLHGAIPHVELQKRIAESDFIVHMENQKEPYKTDLKYAFTTKIADMLASGVCSIVYGSQEIAGIDYFAQNATACVIENEEEISLAIKELIENSEKRDGYIERALNCAKMNHNPVENCKKMNQLLKEVYDEYRRG